VSVTVGPHTYRTTVGVMGGRTLVPLSAENRTAAGVAAGDVVDVEIVLDTAPRTVEVPEDLAAALAEAGLRERFDALAFTHRKEHVRAADPEGDRADSSPGAVRTPGARARVSSPRREALLGEDAGRQLGDQGVPSEAVAEVGVREQLAVQHLPDLARVQPPGAQGRRPDVRPLRERQPAAHRSAPPQSMRRSG
jgi:hypothetical protein